jgi:hypothetical protein
MCMCGYLVVRHKDDALREVGLEASVFCLAELPAHALVAAHAHSDGRPPPGHGCADDTKVLLGHGHPGVEEVFAVEVKWGAEELRNGDAEMCCQWSVGHVWGVEELRQNAAVEVYGEQKHAQCLVPCCMCILSLGGWYCCCRGFWLLGWSLRALHFNGHVSLSEALHDCDCERMSRVGIRGVDCVR